VSRLDVCLPWFTALKQTPPLASDRPLRAEASDFDARMIGRISDGLNPARMEGNKDFVSTSPRARSL